MLLHLADRRRDAPTLAGPLVEPARLAELPAEAIPAALGELARLGALLVARLLTEAPDRPRGDSAHPAARLLTAGQVGERLGLPQWSVYELARRGELPAVRLGRRVRFHPNDVDAYLARHGDTRTKGV